MWMLCNEAQTHVREKVWLESNLGDATPSKARIRELTYRALVEFIERQAESDQAGGAGGE